MDEKEFEITSKKIKGDEKKQLTIMKAMMERLEKEKTNQKPPS